MTDTTQTKRKLPADIQVVDLTSGVPTPLPKRQSQQFHPGVSRSNLAVPQTQQSPQGNRNNSADEDDDALAQEIVDSTQARHDDEEEHIESFQVFYHKAVGIRYYKGIATVGECLLLRREPNNQYDRNAIRVDNVAGVQIGHVPRGYAAKLAPLIDSRTIWLEGKVSGPKCQYEMPIRFEIMIPSREPARSASIVAVMNAKIGGAALSVEHKRIEKEKRDAEKAAKEREKLLMKQKTKGGMPPIGSYQAEIEIVAGESVFQGSQFHKKAPPAPQATIQQSWESLVGGAQMINPRDVGELVQKFGVGEDDLVKMVKATQPGRLKTQLLPYQLQGLAWLLQKEHPQPPKGNEVIQMWKRSGNNYMNLATSFTTKEAPKFASGGILADDMGLGKTLQIISLIVADVTAEKALVPVAKVNPKDCTAGTLIVAPVSVMSNWSGQIYQHVSAETPMKVFRYHGQGKELGDLSEYDVVVTSYGTLVSDFGNKKISKGLFSFKWRRIVIDEAHIIRNPKSKASLAATSIDAASRWALSGTPIVNSLKDLYSLIRFLRFSGGLSEFDIFNRTLMRPLNRGEVGASQLLQIMMATLCLRRVKEMKFVDLRLPGVSEFIHAVKFWPDEQKKYNVLEMEAKGLLVRYQKGKENNEKGQQNDYRFLLEILLRMRQMCNHSSLCGTRIENLMKLAGMDKVDLNEENTRLLQDMLQMAVDAQEECGVCLENLHNPRITICKHVFGQECIEKVIKIQHKCPMCRCELKDLATSTVELSILDSEATNPVSHPEGSSSKIEALLSILQATRQKAPGTKTVIFSQWTSFLNILEPFLKDNGIGFARIDGSMKPQKRDESIERFGKDSECELLLASLAVANVGLNLVMASQVVIIDSWWAPAVEDQAIDRVYRLGQTKAVMVWRLVVAGGIEERVLKIQEKKRMIVADAFREGSGGRKRSSRRGAQERLAELGVLLGGGN